MGIQYNATPPAHLRQLESSLSSEPSRYCCLATQPASGRALITPVTGSHDVL